MFTAPDPLQEWYQNFTVLDPMRKCTVLVDLAQTMQISRKSKHVIES